MKPELQKVTIAEHMGWTASPNMGAIGGYIARHPDGGGCYHNIGHDRNQAIALNCPDYLTDLNAMHEAEKVLTPNQQIEYVEILWGGGHIPSNGLWASETYAIATATAAQRAEAFLRTICKWQDDANRRSGQLAQSPTHDAEHEL